MIPNHAVYAHVKVFRQASNEAQNLKTVLRLNCISSQRQIHTKSFPWLKCLSVGSFSCQRTLLISVASF